MARAYIKRFYTASTPPGGLTALPVTISAPPTAGVQLSLFLCASETPTTPTGWTYGGSATGVDWYHKIASGSETSISISWGGVNYRECAALYLEPGNALVPAFASVDAGAGSQATVGMNDCPVWIGTCISGTQPTTNYVTGISGGAWDYIGGTATGQVGSSFSYAISVMADNVTYGSVSDGSITWLYEPTEYNFKFLLLGTAAAAPTDLLPTILFGAL